MSLTKNQQKYNEKKSIFVKILGFILYYFKGCKLQHLSTTFDDISFFLYFTTKFFFLKQFAHELKFQIYAFNKHRLYIVTNQPEIFDKYLQQ